MNILKKELKREPTAEMVANRLVNTLQHAVHQLDACHRQCEQILNKNPRGFTKKQIVAALGEDAAEAQELHKKVGDFLKSLN